jgi:hypothetical protein
MVDARWQKVIEEHEGIQAFGPRINVDGAGQNKAKMAAESTLSTRQKLALALGGAAAIFFVLVQVMAA